MNTKCMCGACDWQTVETVTYCGQCGAITPYPTEILWELTHCWFCDELLDNEVAIWNGHFVHESCNKPNEFLVISPITCERLERYVAMDVAEGIDDSQECIDEMFVNFKIDELIDSKVCILGVGETPELDSYYGVKMPANVVKTTASVIYYAGDGWDLFHNIVAFKNPENGQHYIHSYSIF
jgi:hypothetical protein